MHGCDERLAGGRLGHPAGDEVLRGVARILDSSRVADDCFRSASYGLAASTKGASDTLFAAADRVLLAAKDGLYGRHDR